MRSHGGPRRSQHDDGDQALERADTEYIVGVLLCLLVQRSARAGDADRALAIGRLLGLLAARRRIGPLLRITVLRLRAQWDRRCAAAARARTGTAAGDRLH